MNSVLRVHSVTVIALILCSTYFSSHLNAKDNEIDSLLSLCKSEKKVARDFCYGHIMLSIIAHMKLNDTKSYYNKIPLICGDFDEIVESIRIHLSKIEIEDPKIPDTDPSDFVARIASEMFPCDD